MAFPLFKTPQRLAAFLVVLAACLVATAHLVAGWLWPAARQARELEEELGASGLELRWDAAERDLGLNLVLEGAEIGGLPTERVTLGGGLVELAGVELGADDLAPLRGLMEALGVSRAALAGVLDVGHGLGLVGSWGGGVADGTLTLTGDATLTRRGRGLEVHSSVHLVEGTVYLALESEGGLLAGRLGPGGFLFSPGLETSELTGLWGGEPLQADGVVCALGWPDEDRWLVWSSGLALRRRGAPEEFASGPALFIYEGGGWTVWLAGLGACRGREDLLAELALRAGLDVRRLARSVLPLGSTGAGRAVCEVLFDASHLPELSLAADAVSLVLPDGMSLSIDGELGLRGGVPHADCRFDTGGGWLRYVVGDDGEAVLTGEGVELNAAWSGGALVRSAISPLGVHFGPLLDPPSLEVELAGCRWGGMLLGDVGGVIRRGDDGWTADLTLTHDGGRAGCKWRFNARGEQRITARLRDLPLELVRILGAEEAGLDPTSGRIEGEVELALGVAGLDSFELNLKAEGVDAPLPPFLVSLWRWADTGTDPPVLSGAEIELTWVVRGVEPGEMAVRLTSPDLRVNFGAGSRAAWSGALELSGRFEVPPALARRMSERGVLVFRTLSGWGAVPFHLGGTWADPRPRLDLVQARLLAASEPPPGTADW
jgi:hypothetical protein